MAMTSSDGLRDPLHQVPLLALAAIILYSLWGRILLLLGCGCLLILVFQNGRTQAADTLAAQRQSETSDEKVRGLQKKLEDTEEEHRITLIRMKQQQNQVLMQLQQIESRISR